jgi:hypothetical protein
MMKPAGLGDGDDLSEQWGLHKSRLRRILGQREVRPGFVIIRHERFQVALQTGLVENDDVGTSDITDAHVVICAPTAGYAVITSDPLDLKSWTLRSG